MKTLFGKGSANWHGHFRRGKGTLTTASGAVKTVSYGSVRYRHDTHTCPDELMAVAQAGCFSLALADELTEAGFKPKYIETFASFKLQEVRSAWTLTEILLDTTAVVPRITAMDFVDVAVRAKERCSMSRLYGGLISMQARLKAPPVRGQKRPDAGKRTISETR